MWDCEKIYKFEGTHVGQFHFIKIQQNLVSKFYTFSRMIFVSIY